MSSVNHPLYLNDFSLSCEDSRIRAKPASSKCQLWFIVLMILGLGELGLAAIGLGGYLGAFPILSSTISVVVLSIGSVSSVVVLALGILGYVKHRSQNKSAKRSEDLNFVQSGQASPAMHSAQIKDLLYFEYILNTCKDAAERGDYTDIKHTLQIKNVGFTSWFNITTSEFCIQDEASHLACTNNNLISIHFIQPGCPQIKINGQLQTSAEIPSNFLPQVKTFYYFYLQASSQYKYKLEKDRASLRVKIYRGGLQAIPAFHLKQLAALVMTGLKHEPCLKIEVVFYENSIGADLGGLSRDYLDDLFAALIQASPLRFQLTPSSFLIPKTQRDYLSDQTVSLEQEEQTLYECLGTIMMYCYNSKTGDRGRVFDTAYCIGRYFDDALFKAVLCLSAEEINISFHQLEFTTLLKICRALVEAIDEPLYLKRIELLSKDFLSDAEWNEAATIAFYAGCLPESLIQHNVPDQSKILISKETVKTALTKALFEVEGCMGQIGTLLAPIQAIAQGMLTIVGRDYWDQLRSSISYLQFSNKIQGTFNRENVIKSFHLDPDIASQEIAAISEKASWLIDWLEEEATEKELRNFLKYVTGSSSLPTNQKITIKAQSRLDDELGLVPTIRARSCSYEIWISPLPSGDEYYNDQTRNNFIKCIKELILTDPGAYSLN